MAMSPSVSASARARITANVAVMVAAAIGIFVLVNYFAGQSRFRRSFDWTATASNTLSDRSKGILQGLPEKLGRDSQGRDRVVEVASFLEPETQIEARAIQLVHQLLEAYRNEARGRLAVTRFQEYTDLVEATKKVKELKLKERPNRDELVMALGDRVRTIRLADLVRITGGYGGLMGQRDEPPTIAENRIEETLTSNVLAILDAEKPKIYFLTGHGEPDPESTQRDGVSRLAEVLRGNGYDVQALDLAAKEGVPGDASVVVWLSPTRVMLQKELAALKRYAHEGGRLVVAPDLPLEPGRDADALALLAEYGIRSPNGIVCVPLVNAFTGEELQGAPDAAFKNFIPYRDVSAANPITKSFFEQRLNLPMPFARAFERIEGSASAAFTEDLGRTLKDSWVDLEPVDYVCDPQKEPRGPKTVLTTAVMKAGSGNGSAPASKPAPEAKEGRLVAIGAAATARNELFDFGRDLYLAAVEWAAGREFAAGIGPRPVQKNALANVAAMLPRVVGASLLLTGLAFLAAGYVWWVRRGERAGLVFGAVLAVLPILFGLLNFAFAPPA